MLVGFLAVQQCLVFVVLVEHVINDNCSKFLGEVLLLVDGDISSEALPDEVELVPSKDCFTEDHV